MSKFYVWIDKNVNANTLDEASFQTACENGFQAGQPARALEANSAIRQANLIAVALMQSLGLVDKANLQSTVTDVANLFSNTELFKLTNVFSSTGKVKMRLLPGNLGMSIGAATTNNQFDGYFRYVSVKTLADVTTFVGKQISDIFAAPTKDTDATVVAAQTLTGCANSTNVKVKANSALIAVEQAIAGQTPTTVNILPYKNNTSAGNTTGQYTTVNLGGGGNDKRDYFDTAYFKEAYIDNLRQNNIIYSKAIKDFDMQLSRGLYLFILSGESGNGPTTCLMYVNGFGSYSTPILNGGSPYNNAFGKPMVLAYERGTGTNGQLRAYTRSGTTSDTGTTALGYLTDVVIYRLFSI